MSAWMPAPPPESDPAILRIRTGFFIGAYRSGRCFPLTLASPTRGEGKIRAQSAEVDTGSAKDCATNQKARVISNSTWSEMALGAAFPDHLRDLAAQLANQLPRFSLA